MASTSMARWIFSLFLTAFSLVHALRVSPDSPCTSVCTTSDVSQSDPNFFDNQWKDIVCNDEDINSKPEGKDMKSCFTCLQNSTYSNGSENDQDWFLYNLRYASSYCMFGYPNSTGIESGPCTTSVGCGSLASAVEFDIKNPTNSSSYDYCDVNGGAITSSDVVGCLQCVTADGEHQYLSNFLLALQGACQKKPAPGSLLILNSTLFGSDNVQVIDQTPSTNSGDSKLSSSTIVGIAVGGIVLLALVAGFTFMCIRKRKNRAKQLARTSDYSFRCQTRVTPVTPRFPEGVAAEDDFYGGEKAHVRVTTGVGANPYPVGQYPWNSQSSLNITISRQESAIMRPSIITALTPPIQAHFSPRATSPDDFATPASAVSTRSNAPLLSHQPAGYSPSPHLSPSSWSLSPKPYRPDGRWEEETGVTNALGLITRKRSKIGVGSPVQTDTIITSFPPPPTR